MSETAAILKQAQAGNAHFYVQFGGQGAPWYKELAKYYKEPAFQKFFDAALSAIDEERPRVEGSVGLPHGIDARAWLEDDSKIPSEEYLGCAAVSIAMIQMAQLAHLENLLQNGFPMNDLVANLAGTTGHSQGLIPASLVALNRTGDEYYAAVKKYMKYLLYLGVSAQKAFPHFEATAEENAKSEALGGKAPSPMVAVLGLDHDAIQKMVDEVNTGLPADQKIYISLYNSPTNRILSSYRGSLIAFHEKFKADIDEKKFKFVYLRTTCPFHCKLMEPVREFFLPEIERIGFDYKGEELKVPVYSFYDQANLQEAGAKLPVKMFEDMAINPLYWDKSMAPAVADKKVTHILDFGPGKTSQRLSADTLKELGREIPVLGAAIPKDLKEILGS
ncbi:MAG: ACP S-malonyltransferase [Leptospirales bacterium]|jgi:malonyl CoA-acyl carrier protein transacylase